MLNFFLSRLSFRMEFLAERRPPILHSDPGLRCVFCENIVSIVNQSLNRYRRQTLFCCLHSRQRFLQLKSGERVVCIASELANARLAIMAVVGIIFRDGPTGSARGDILHPRCARLAMMAFVAMPDRLSRG